MERREVWAIFAAAALTGLIASEGIIEAEEAVGLAREYANHMIVEYNKWFLND